MSTDQPVSKMVRLPWWAVLLALVVGIGFGVAIDRFALPHAADPDSELFEQIGSIESGAQGQVQFPFPYALPPNVELDCVLGLYVIVETTPTGFTWRDTSVPRNGQGGKWIAKGIKATNVP